MRLAVVMSSALAALGLFGGSGTLSAPAGADCVGPTIEHTTGTIDRGATIRVEGVRWGRGGGTEECSADEPLRDITVVVVQNGAEHVVAVGDADEHDAFVVEAPLPQDLEPGLADVRAGSPLNPQSYDASPERLVVSGAPVPADHSEAPVRFGPDDIPVPPARGAPSGRGSESTSNRFPASRVAAVVVAAGLFVAIAALVRRRARS